MPVMNGVEATQILRSHGVLIPIIAVTGNALAEDVNAFIAAGCNHVLTKRQSTRKDIGWLRRWKAPFRLDQLSPTVCVFVCACSFASPLLMMTAINRKKLQEVLLTYLAQH